MGNILTASDGVTTHTYSYTDAQWQDLLTAFDGHPIAYQGQTYDAETNTVTGTPTSGNPVSYFNGTRWSFGWTNGRQLVTATDGDTDLSYTYNADGLRMTKTVDGVVHTYLYAGGKLLRETYGTTTLDFFYGSNGNPFALKVDDTVYYYITNLQGDVLRLVDADGSTVAAYTYDPYGKVLTATGTIASVNPLRYRGYYYDTETGFYYLQSRYYDPTTCRFLNADSYASTGQGILGHNMFAYCGNNTVSSEDSVGNMRKPCTVNINDGGYAEVYIVTDGDELSKNLASFLADGNHQKSSGTVLAYVQSAGSYVQKDDRSAQQAKGMIEVGTGIASMYAPKSMQLADALATPMGIIAAFMLLDAGWSLLQDLFPASDIIYPGTYPQYKVIEKWSDTQRLGNIVTRTDYTAEQYYILWQDLLGQPQWRIIEYTQTYEITTYLE